MRAPDEPLDPNGAHAAPAVDWRAFLAQNATLVAEARLSAMVLRSREHFEDFLRHGYLDAVDDPDDFTVDEMDEESYDALKKLVVVYFEAGAPFFAPIALRRDDYMAMAHRFGQLEDPMP